MNNTIVIYRPFVNIHKSVESLEETIDLYHIGKIHTYLTIRSFLGQLNLIDHKDNLIEKNESLQFYWNDGNPYIFDLITYYNYSKKLWMKKQGLPIDFLKPYKSILEELDIPKHKAPWTKEMANVHKIALLQRNRFWYKRKFLEIKDLELKTKTIFKDGKPREINANEIRSQTKTITPKT